MYIEHVHDGRMDKKVSWCFPDTQSLTPTSSSGKEKPVRRNQAFMGDTPDGWLVKQEEKEGRRGRGQTRPRHHTCKHINYTRGIKARAERVTVAVLTH